MTDARSFAKTDNPHEHRPALEIYRHTFTIDKLVYFGKSFAEYIKSYGTEEPTQYSLINWGLSFAGGYIHINQPYAKRANHIINQAIENYAKDSHKTAIYVTTALEELSKVRNEMVSQNRIGSICNKIAEILQAYGLPLNKNDFEKEMDKVTSILKNIEMMPRLENNSP
jgi:hypothetical protein